MGDEEDGEEIEVQATPLTADVAAPGLSLLKDVGNLSFNYTKLELKGKAIVDLQDLAKYPALRLLDLSENQLSDATQVQELKSLLSITMNNNQLTSLNGLSSLEHLQLLSLKSNQIASIDALDLPTLMYLNLDDNQLTALPASLSSCTKLRVLEVRDNKLTTTAGIEGLDELEEAQFARNEISDLCLGKMPQLRTLTLGTNQITSLSAFAENVARLETLDLSANQMAAACVEGGSRGAKDIANLAGLSCLQTLTLTESPITGAEGFRRHVYAALPKLATLDGEPYAEDDQEPPPEIVEEPPPEAPAE